MRLPSALLLALAFALACGSKSSSSDGALTKPFFWSATKDGKTTYFLGTMHMGIDPARLPAVVFEKLDAAPIFVHETDTDDPAGLALGRRTDGGTLRQDIGGDHYARLEKLLIDPKVLDGLNQLKPVVAAIVLQQQRMPATPSMDATLKQRAQSAKKELRTLEPVTKQVRLLEKWFDARMLKSFIDHPERLAKATTELMDVYIAGDEAKLEEHFTADMTSMVDAGFTKAESDQAIYELLYERNAAWIEELEKVHARGNAFVAVGAAHLVGPKSVLALLAARGYTITRITP
jgi:uncharacterized protein YbaP (TraB family)